MTNSSRSNTSQHTNQPALIKTPTPEGPEFRTQMGMTKINWKEREPSLQHRLFMPSTKYSLHFNNLRKNFHPFTLFEHANMKYNIISGACLRRSWETQIPKKNIISNSSGLAYGCFSLNIQNRKNDASSFSLRNIKMLTNMQKKIVK